MSEDMSVKDKATESTQAGKQAAGEVAQTAANKAQDVAQEAKSQARNVVGEARDQLRGHAGDQHRNAVTNLRSLGEELRSMTQNGQPDGVATNLVGQAADRAHQAADWLDGRQPEDLLEELRRFARRRPGAFLLGALAAGVVAGRVTRGAVGAHTDDSDQRASSAGNEIHHAESSSTDGSAVQPTYETPPAVGTYESGAGYSDPSYSTPSYSAPSGGPAGTVPGTDPYASPGTDPYASPGTDPYASPGTDPYAPGADPNHGVGTTGSGHPS